MKRPESCSVPPIGETWEQARRHAVALSISIKKKKHSLKRTCHEGSTAFLYGNKASAELCHDPKPYLSNALQCKAAGFGWEQTALRSLGGNLQARTYQAHCSLVIMVTPDDPDIGKAQIKRS